MQEFQEAVCLGIFRTVARHSRKNQFGVRTEHGKLDIECRVEHHVCCFLEWRNPLIFCFTDIAPLADGLLCRIGTFIIIADDASQQSVVLCGNPVVRIEGNAGERRDVDAEFQ